MMQLLVLLSLGLAVAVWFGARRHATLMRNLLVTLQEFFPEADHQFVRLTSSGVGFTFIFPSDAPRGAIREIRGALTVLPRYTPMYLPLARALGRMDLLRFTCHVTAMPMGIGVLRRHCTTPIPFDSLDDDPDLHHTTHTCDNERFTAMTYNPAVRQRLERVIPLIAEHREILQLACNHQDQTITCFVIPGEITLRNTLETALTAIFTLTTE